MALSKGKQVRSLGASVDSAPQKGSTTIYVGGLVMIQSSSGLAAPGAVATGYYGVGVAQTYRDIDKWDNSSGADSALTVVYDEGIFLFVNSGSDPIAAADTGKICFIVDDQTVAKTSSNATRSPAGRVYKVASEGVYVIMSKAIGANCVDMIGNAALDPSAVHLAGTETITGVKTFSAAPVVGAGLTASGAVANDFSGSTGTFKTSTGLNTVGGDLLMAANKIAGFGAPQALSGVGAVNVTTLVTNFTSNGSAQALSLADGTQAGQLKIVHHTVDGGSGVLTPTTAGNFATFTLTNVHDACLLQWSGSAWNMALNVGGTVG